MKDLYSSSFLFILVFLINVFGMQGQNPLTKQSLDSAQYYYQISINPTNSTSLVSALNYYEREIKQNLGKRDTVLAIYNLRNLASVQFDLGLVYEGDISMAQALSLVEKSPINPKTNEIKKGINNQLGIIYRRLKNTEKAIEYYTKALSFSANTSDSLTLRNNLAFVYIDMEEFARAEQELTAVYQRRLKLDNKIELARALDNLSFVQGKLGNPVALKNTMTALDMRLELKDTKSLFSSYRHLTYYYLDRNEKEKARRYADSSYAIAKSLESSTYLVEALSFYVVLDEEPKVTAYKRITDSISYASQLKQNKFAAMKYDVAREMEKTEAAKLLNEAQKHKTLLSQGIVVFVLLAGIFLYFILRANHKKEKIGQIYKTETRISKKLHDEVANDIYQVMTKLQIRSIVNEEVLDDLEGIYSKTRDISKESAAICVEEDFGELLNDLLLGYKSNTLNIITRNISKIDWNGISEIKKITIYRVLQELMTNMKKHSAATLVVVMFSTINKKLIIEYTDNGIGGELKKNEGLLNTENRMESINGYISFESLKDKGFKAIITI